MALNMYKIDPDEKRKILLTGEDFPLIKNIIEEETIKKDCRIYFDLKYGSFDYILVFGLVKRKKPIISKLKKGGKIIQILTEDQTSRSSFPFFVLDLSRATASDVLAKKILKRLFSQKPYLPKEKVQKRISGTGSFSAKKKIALSLFFIIFLPWLVFLSAFYLGTQNLLSLQNSKDPLSEREKKAGRGFFELKIAQKGGYILAGLISPFLNRESEIIKESFVILEKVAESAKEAVVLEKILKNDQISFFGENSDFKEKAFPKIEIFFTKIKKNFTLAENSVVKISAYKNSFILKKYWSNFEMVLRVNKIISDANIFLDVAPGVFGFDEEKKYLLLFQNNFELRPTGGFIGSYAVLTVEGGNIKNIRIEDVYTADGQLKGRVEPPKPIQTVLNQQSWYLRDSNWDPDFFKSASQAEWFLQKETGEKFDGVIGMDLYFIANLLKALDKVYVPDYQAFVTASDFFYKLQSERENDFFPGSSKKKDLISSLASALVITFQDKKDISWMDLFTNLYSSLEEKHLLLYFNDNKVEEEIEKLGFGGRILTTDDQNADYFMLVEANLGVNKINYYITRKLEFDLTLTPKQIEKRVKIYFKNSYQQEKTENNQYKNYLRVLLPERTNLESIRVDGISKDLLGEIDTSYYEDKIIIGFLNEVLPGKESIIDIHYKLPVKIDGNNFSYQFLIQKQPGIEILPVSVKVGKEDFFRIVSSKDIPAPEELRKDRLILIDFEKTIQ